MGARPYDATLGRFLTTDPIDGGSLNNYDYANQDPINQNDLSGNGPGPASRPSNPCAKNRKACKGVSLASIVSKIVSYSPAALALAAGIACTVATDGACAPLAYAAVATAIAKAARDDGIVGSGKANWGRFAADTAIAVALEGAAKGAEAATKPFYTQGKADRVVIRGAANAILQLLNLTQSVARR